MPQWVKKVFLQQLPYYLLMRRPLEPDEESFRRMSNRKKAIIPDAYQQVRIFTLLSIKKKGHVQAFLGKYTMNYHTDELAEGYTLHPQKPKAIQLDPSSNEFQRKLRKQKIAELYYSPPVLKAFKNICFVAELLKKKDRDEKVVQYTNERAKSQSQSFPLS